MTPLERAAVPIAKALSEQFNLGFTAAASDDGWEKDMDQAIALARAVLEAIREPSEAMMAASIAASQHDFAITRAGTKRAYGAMIDAALSEQGKP